MVDDAGDLVRRRDLGLRRADTGLQAAIERSKGTVAARHGSRRLEEGLTGAVVALARGGTDGFAAGDLVVGAEPKPGGEVLDGGELGHIGADFANNLLRQVEAEAVYGRDVHPGQAAQVLTDTDGCLFGKVLAVRTTLIGRQGLPVIGSRVRPVWADGGVGALDFEVAGFDLAGVEVIEFQRLLEDEEVLLAPGAGEGLGDFVFGFLAARVAQGGEFMGVTLTGDDGADDGQAGLTGDVGDGLIEADVHVNQRLLHVQHVRRAMLDQLGTMA